MSAKTECHSRACEACSGADQALLLSLCSSDHANFNSCAPLHFHVFEIVVGGLQVVTVICCSHETTLRTGTSISQMLTRVVSDKAIGSIY